MSEDFVDVRWRGLEVAPKARLRAIAGGRGYVEHGAPMPTGTALTLHTADGHVLAATVAAVCEQIGGRTEPPGMELVVAADGDAAAWWRSRADGAGAVDAPAPVDRAIAAEARTRTIPPAELAAAVAAAGVAAPVVVAAPTDDDEARPTDDARPTEVMMAVAPDDAGDDASAAAAEPPPEVPEAVPVELSDDGRRTSVMAAVDIEAIVAAGEAAAAAAPADEPSAGDGKKKGARGKRRRGR